MSTRICCFVGWPGSIGGAGSESFETQKMFRRHGIEVHCVPTWEAPPPDRRREVEALGVQIHDLKPPQLPGLLRDLGGPPVVSFINDKFLPHAYRIREISPWIHIPCMTYVHSWERVAFKKCGLPDALVFQSEYQREVYHTGLLRHGYRQEIGHSIRGAFEFADWHYRPLAREPGTPFVVGRISRPDTAKWNGQLFNCLDPVPNVRAVLLGVDEAVRRNIGRRKYATQWPPGHMPAREFYSKLHAQVAMNGGAKENWPRVGLESMALGVPLVVDGHWGWPEMVQDGQTGFLCRRAAEFADALATLERDEALRLRICEQARWSLEHVLANPAMIWRGWGDLFRRIGAGHLVDEPDYGLSPVQASTEQLNMMAAAQEYAREVYESAACPQFIAGEKIEPGSPVVRGPDGLIYNIGLDPARPGDDRTEIVYIPGEELHPGTPLEIVPNDEGEPRIQRAEHQTGVVAAETLTGQHVTIDELGRARNPTDQEAP
jgi:glycosyltransferase involved in cell wall biosynthesis